MAFCRETLPDRLFELLLWFNDDDEEHAPQLMQEKYPLGHVLDEFPLTDPDAPEVPEEAWDEALVFVVELDGFTPKDVIKEEMESDIKNISS